MRKQRDEQRQEAVNTRQLCCGRRRGACRGLRSSAPRGDDGNMRTEDAERIADCTPTGRAAVTCAEIYLKTMAKVSVSSTCLLPPPPPIFSQSHSRLSQWSRQLSSVPPVCSCAYMNSRVAVHRTINRRYWPASVSSAQEQPSCHRGAYTLRFDAYVEY